MVQETEYARTGRETKASEADKEALVAQTKFIDRAWYELKILFYEKMFVGGGK